MTELVEMKKMLEKQLKLISDLSEKTAGFESAELALLSEQLVNVGRFLLDIAPAANRVAGSKANAVDKSSVNVDVTVRGLDEAQSKAERLVETVKSAKTLAGELADLLGNLSVDVKG